MKYSDAAALLAGPGAPFEVVTEIIGGRPTPMYKTRERSLREKIANAAIHGDKVCMVYGDQRLTYSDFVQRVWGAGHALRDAHGLAHGDRVAILAMNRPDWLIALFGAVSVGGIAVGLNGWWATEELAYGLLDSGARFLIVDEHLYPRVADVLGQIPTLERVFFIGEDPPEGAIPIDTLLSPRPDMPTVPLSEHDPFVILYTSGTTGRAKGCITTHAGTIAQVNGVLFKLFVSLLQRAAQDAAERGEPLGAAPATPSLMEQPTTLLTSPLFHVAGLHAAVCTALSGGAKMVFGAARFDPVDTLRVMQDEGVTSWMAIPTLLQRLVDHPDVHAYDLSKLMSISTGGAPTPPETLEQARRVLKTKPSMGTTYGLTETHGMASSIGGPEYDERPHSVGRLIPTLRVKIIDGEGHELPVGQAGEILLSGPTVTPGYWNRPEDTADTIRDGWLHTGDIGYVDDNGFLYISDRAKDMILRGGENVYCVEIENCLSDHPEIDEAAVIGVPDKDLGERVKAVVRRRPNSDLPPEAVKAHVAARLARFKVPEEVVFIDQPLPRNPSGKVLKDLLRDATRQNRFMDQL